jgi:hypothetical protein
MKRETRGKNRAESRDAERAHVTVFVYRKVAFTRNLKIKRTPPYSPTHIMARKRTAEDDDAVPPSSSSVHSSPTKRRRQDTTSFPPQTPAASAGSSSSSKHPFATPKTPYTPYPLHASDSPSNPFGRKRKERLVHSLPPVSSFSKHIALRFQFVRRGISPRQGGVYRVVRVPKNYTFTHLRALIAWLFDTPARYANGKACEEEFLFEVKSKTMFYSPLYKPSQIKSGTTTVKLSNVRDPGRWHSGHGFGSEEDELSEEEDELEELGSQVEGEENGDEDWKWVDEEDFTLAHAWPQGIDPLISIIYVRLSLLKPKIILTFSHHSIIHPALRSTYQ